MRPFLSLADYGRIIARRYEKCAHPLDGLAAGEPAGASSGNNLSERDQESVAECISQSVEVEKGRLDAHGRLDEERAPHGRGAWADDLLCRVLDPCPSRKFSVLVTHDLDRTTLWEATALAKRLIRRKAREPETAAWPLFGCRRVIEKKVDELLRFEADQNIRSIFFFLSGSYGLGRYGSRTSLSWRSAKSILCAVQAAGMEIGLHGSYYAKDKCTYVDECRRLEDAAHRLIRHHRNHYLRYDTLRVWGQLSEAGISFDHSVGFVGGWGFRTGTCIPYPAYDLSAGAVSTIVEVPMLLMDGPWAEKEDPNALTAVRAALEVVQRHRGCVSINFHPEALATNSIVWESFKRIVGICRELGAEMAQWEGPDVA